MAVQHSGLCPPAPTPRSARESPSRGRLEHSVRLGRRRPALRGLRAVVIVALMAAIVLFWSDYAQIREEHGARFAVVGEGVSLAALGILYKLLGSWDLIPDAIPLLGRADDFVASLIVLAGCAAAALGWTLL